MARSKGNWQHNYPRLKTYLKKRDYEYEEYNGGQHFKILGPTAAIELWPSKMTYHIIEAEENNTTLYFRNIIDTTFNEKQMDALL